MITSELCSACPSTLSPSEGLEMLYPDMQTSSIFQPASKILCCLYSDTNYMQFNSSTDYLGLAQTSQVKGNILQKTALASHQAQVQGVPGYPNFWLTAYKLRSSPTLSDLIIFQNSAQNSEKSYTYDYGFIIMPTTQDQPNAGIVE